jgi:sentrin-specific protease 1
MALGEPVAGGLLDALANHPPRDNLVADKYDLNITVEKINCLKDGVWLNSEVITFWLEWWCEQVGAGSQGRGPSLTSNPRCWFANTYFFARLTGEGRYNYDAVRRWTDKVDVFSLEKVIIPINVTNTHWFLAVIDFRNKWTQVFDSMGSIRVDVHDTLHRWLQDEHWNKHGTALDRTWGRHLNGAAAVPQQDNNCDCGVFMCLFAAYASLNLPFSFSQQHIPLVRRWMVQIIYKVGAATGPGMPVRRTQVTGRLVIRGRARSKRLRPGGLTSRCDNSPSLVP